ncbi:hypothetical protein, partial [Tahibacter harae]
MSRRAHAASSRIANGAVCLARHKRRGAVAGHRSAWRASVVGAPPPRATSRHIHRRGCRDDDARAAASDLRDTVHTPRSHHFGLRNFAQIGRRAVLQAVRELNAHARAAAARRARSAALRGRRCDGRPRRG